MLKDLHLEPFILHPLQSAHHTVGLQYTLAEINHDFSVKPNKAVNLTCSKIMK